MRFLEALAFAGASLDGVGQSLNSLALEAPTVNKARTFPTLFARNDTGGDHGNTTVNMFIDDAFDGQAGYAASVVTACLDQTVYAIRCTSARFAGSNTCGPNAPVSLFAALDTLTAWLLPCDLVPVELS